MIYIYRICDLRGVGQFRTEFGRRRKACRCHVEVGKIQECQHWNGKHVQANSKAQPHIPIQKTLVPRPVHGSGRSSGKRIVVPSGAAWPPVRSISSYR